MFRGNNINWYIYIYIYSNIVSIYTGMETADKTCMPALLVLRVYMRIVGEILGNLREIQGNCGGNYGEIQGN